MLDLLHRSPSPHRFRAVPRRAAAGRSAADEPWWPLLRAVVALAVVDVREHRLPDLLVLVASVGVARRVGSRLRLRQRGRLGLVQRQVNLLAAQRVNKIVLISHLQNIDEDVALIAGLRRIDVAIADGGDGQPGGRRDPG